MNVFPLSRQILWSCNWGIPMGLCPRWSSLCLDRQCSVQSRVWFWISVSTWFHGTHRHEGSWPCQWTSPTNIVGRSVSKFSAWMVSKARTHLDRKDKNWKEKVTLWKRYRDRYNAKHSIQQGSGMTRKCTPFACSLDGNRYFDKVLRKCLFMTNHSTALTIAYKTSRPLALPLNIGGHLPL